jgi:alpha-galactosidase
MLLSGDDLTKITPDHLAMLRKLVPPTGVPAAFEDVALRVGFVRLKDRLVVCLLNWSDQPQALAFELPHGSQVHDFWSGQSLGQHPAGSFEVKDLPAHSARLLICTPNR